MLVHSCASCRNPLRFERDGDIKLAVCCGIEYELDRSDSHVVWCHCPQLRELGDPEPLGKLNLCSQTWNEDAKAVAAQSSGLRLVRPGPGIDPEDG